MGTIKVDFSKNIGKIKPVHSVGQPPFSGVDFSMCSYLKEANIPYSRLHDVGGPYGGNLYVDIPNVFRNFDADPSDPKSYDFAFTDRLITALIENDVKPVYRLGVSIENNAWIKAYRIYPPKDFLKWARICEGIIKHYNEGWANGFHYGIEYWEIWNEPENHEDMMKNPMWRGTKEQFFDLYVTASKYLKEKFPDLKIGGYGHSGFYAVDGSWVAAGLTSSRVDRFITFFEEFLVYIKEHHAPLDFFSWHSYGEIEQVALYTRYARKKLDDAGFRDTELTCNEWNCQVYLRGTARHAALNTGMLLSMQNLPLDSAMFYDARVGISVYGGLFHPLEKRPYPTYYGFKAFGKLYKLGNQVEAICDEKGVYIVAAKDKQTGGILISNTGDEVPLCLEIQGQRIVRCYVLDETHCLEECMLPEKLDRDTVLYFETEG